MSLKLCLKKKKNVYHIIITKKTAHPKKLFIENVGFYTTFIDNWKNKYVYIKIDRLLHWLIKGLKMTNTTYSLIRPFILIKLT